MTNYYMLVGNDGKVQIEEPVASDSMGVLKFLVQDNMIAVILNINPDLCVLMLDVNVRDYDVIARHVIKIHTTKDGWYVPEDKSEWYTIWEHKKVGE